MKQQQDKKLEQMLRSSGLVAGGFMGADSRNAAEVIAEDLKTLVRLGYEPEQIAEKMRSLTDMSKPALGGWVRAAENLQVKNEDFKGFLVCPWSHPGRFDKRTTTVQRLDTGKSISWSDLNIHLIERHGFFEGKGSLYRIEPEELVNILY